MCFGYNLKSKGIRILVIEPTEKRNIRFLLFSDLSIIPTHVIKALVKISFRLSHLSGRYRELIKKLSMTCNSGIFSSSGASSGPI